jgi:hypothetical protein
LNVKNSVGELQGAAQALVGLKHTAKTASGLPVSTAWIEMPPKM